MSTVAKELEVAAATAWASLSRVPNVLDRFIGAEPMPIGAALDYVQNVTGDRDDAVTALMNAAANRLQSLRADIMDCNAILREAMAVESTIRSEDLSLARSCRDTVYFRAVGTAQDIQAGLWPTAAKGSVNACDLWRLWAVEAERFILLCEKIVKAAYQE